MLGLIVVEILILFSGSLGISAAGRVMVKTIHVWLGYVMTINLPWRFVWAFFGNRYARWHAILPGAVAAASAEEGNRFGASLAPVRVARMSALGVRRGKAAPFQWVKGPPGDLAPAGSNRSSHGGDEMAEVFG